jgi:RND superfamily putative drug exporter
VVAWALATAACILAPRGGGSTSGQVTDLLPSGTPARMAVKSLAEYFPGQVGLSQAVVVFERTDGALTREDLSDVERAAGAIARPGAGPAGADELRLLSIRSPRSLALPGGRNPLVSADRQAALVMVNLPYDFSSIGAGRLVTHIQSAVSGAGLRPGLSAAVTGSAAYGHDYAVATERSHHKTLAVTLIAVVVILVAVYRAPLAAVIPLAAISMATAVATRLLSAGHFVGVESGTAERIFLLVLVYGAGVDYSLLFLSRYAEFLDEGHPSGEAVARGLSAGAAAVLSSATTTVAGLAMLYSAEFGVFRNTAAAAILALVVASLASLTLVPALVGLIGPRVFWPARRQARGKESSEPSAADRDAAGGPENGVRPQRKDIKGSDPILPPPGLTSGFRGHSPRARLWPAVAAVVVNRPWLVLGVALAFLTVPAVRGARITWVYDSLTSLKPSYDAMRGAEMIKRHWPIGEVAPVTVLAVADAAQSAATWQWAYDHILTGLRALPDVRDVRGLDTPLGLGLSTLDNLAVLSVAGSKVQREYVSEDGRAMRLSVVLGIPPLTLAAMDDLGRIRSAAEGGLTAAGIGGTVQLAGTTADLSDLRTVTQGDFWRVAALSLAAILLLLVAFLRDVRLSLFMVGATVLSYLTTLGLSFWCFRLLGHPGLDWKVQVILFVVLVAVGQDYNVFFAVRLAEEAQGRAVRPATERALVRTGPVISSCGVIMAATLGSVMAGDITLLVQLGFALALGMLIDTFVVRPLLLPAFIVLTGRTLSRAAEFVRHRR